MTSVLLAILALAAPAPAGERVVEEIVAVVRNPPSAPARVVTLTKLQDEARIALVSRGATEAATGPLDREALGAALDWLLDQMVLADEAARLRIADVEREEVLEELSRFKARFPAPDAYDRFLAANELREEELIVTLGRMARVRRYLESRVGRAARVSDDEVDGWFRERGKENSPVAREAVRAHLAEEKARAHVKDLLADLRGRARIKIVSFGSGAGEN